MLRGNNCLYNADVATLDCIGPVLQGIVNFAIAFAGGVAVILIIYSAFKLATARGDREKLESAKHTLIYAIIGFLIIVFAFVIMRLIADFIGVNPRDIGVGP